MREIVTLSPGRDGLKVEALLQKNGLRLARGLTVLLGAVEGETLVGCAGRRENVIECAAVEPSAQGEGILAALVTRLVTDIRLLGYEGAFVFTKPETAPKFCSLGFCPVAETRDAALLYSRRNAVETWAAGLTPPSGGLPRGCVVMNANPFTRGHRYLIERALDLCGGLYVLVVETEASRFSFPDRLRLVREGTADLNRLTVCGAGPFLISRATFPDYFLKRPGETARVHGELDAAVFAGRVAPALSVTARFLGSEPTDPLTAAYNGALLRTLPPAGISVTVLDRLRVNGAPVSAARVRALLDEGRWEALRPLVPESTFRFFMERKEADRP